MIRLFVAVSGLALVAGLIVAVASLRPARADSGDARNALAKSQEMLRNGNANGARAEALKAVRAAPNSASAHALLARTMLELDDGIGAESELDRAVAAGFDKAKLHQLYAHAWLLQGDPDRALKELDQADPQYRVYTLRIRGRALNALGNLAGARDALESATQIAPDDADAWTDLGVFRFAIGDIAGAIDASEHAVKADPDNVEALLLRARLVRTQFGLVAALPWFETALKHDPWRYSVLIEYAATLGDAGRASDSLAAIRRAMASRPGSVQGYYLQAVIAARAGQYDLARSVLQHAGDGLDGLPGALLLKGSLDIAGGGYQQAIESLQELVARQPMNIAARKLLALAYMRADAAKDALDVLRPVGLRGDADSYTLSLAARGFERIGDRQMADHLLDRAANPAPDDDTPFSSDDDLSTLAADAQNHPNQPAANVALVRGLLDAGKSDEALARAQRIARDNPGTPESAIMVGDVLATMGRFDEAATAYRAAANIRFDEPTMLRLVDTLDQAGKRQEASDTLALFLSQNPMNIAALRLLAHWQIAGGDFDAAVDTLESLHARIGDRDAALLAELASAYSGLGADDVARAYGAAAYRLAPVNPAVVDAYGWAQYQAGDNQSAIQLLEKAVVIAPEHSGLRWHLAQAYAAAGKTQLAAEQARKALADPHFQNRADAQKLAATA